jgi:hypothetical protein
MLREHVLALVKMVRPTGGEKEMGLFEGECGKVRTDDSQFLQNITAHLQDHTLSRPQDHGLNNHCYRNWNAN